MKLIMVEPGRSATQESHLAPLERASWVAAPVAAEMVWISGRLLWGRLNLAILVLPSLPMGTWTPP